MKNETLEIPLRKFRNEEIAKCCKAARPMADLCRNMDEIGIYYYIKQGKSTLRTDGNFHGEDK